ncbi:anthranilate synthase component 1 [Oikeobacillus pervagus]|uniref:Anthranilate synthase component 1 n=1 Tax=Oikeobacillus pervagus TaxID=1325931 RepID=A0AAJ1SX14_9BACI|nr:anthranilate synthase component I [Oikeobacillus pervagus]MDQ0214358.1 anthranilate synthase component 1 [Oikeobacillus pervagus]
MSTTTKQNYILKEIEGDLITPISVFKRLKGRKKFLFESSYKHEESGRYSFLGLNPYLEYKAIACDVYISSDSKNQKDFFKGNPIEKLKKMFPIKDMESLPFPFFGGAIGFIGYDVIRHFEQIGDELNDSMKMPDIHLMFYEDIVVFDHLFQKVYVVSLNLSGDRTDEEMNETVQKIEQDILQESMFRNQVKVEPLDFESNHTFEEYCEKVRKAKNHIIKGDIFQVVLSQRLKASFKGDSFEFYRQLRRVNPSPYMFYIDFESYTIIGASPESLIKVTGNKVMTNPIAGTRPRGLTKQEDVKLEKDLLADEKEIAEHHMLVDLGRNDLGKVCEIGSIKVAKDKAVEKYKHVMHIVSEVTGELKKHVHPLDALMSILPAGTVSGAPKIRAMQIINDLETEKRGVYAGAIGYMSANGDFDFALAIRTMVVKDQVAYVQAGAGIVYDSIPEKEYEETLNKAKALLEVEA